MKKFLLILLILSVLLPVTKVRAQGTELLAGAKSGILIEATTKKILFEKNKDEKLPMASLTKMVAQIIILEQIEQGKLKW